jgi:hypothetical protein
MPASSFTNASLVKLYYSLCQVIVAFFVLMDPCLVRRFKRIRAVAK